jgi:hypothetical protein
VPSPNPGSPNNTANILVGVAATSTTNAWAVGRTCHDCGGESEFNDPLIVHWNGTTWKQQPSPNPSGGSSVAATSATNAWAVGSVIVHWNGTTWKQQPSPMPAGLNAVAATSATNAWAVGLTGGGTLHQNTLALHCC